MFIDYKKFSSKMSYLAVYSILYICLSYKHDGVDGFARCNLLFLPISHIHRKKFSNKKSYEQHIASAKHKANESKATKVSSPGGGFYDII